MDYILSMEASKLTEKLLPSKHSFFIRESRSIVRHTNVMSDIDGADGIMTMENLKTALRTERKALNMLYSELEEERNASAVAANQTMAMINRLQEEKAAMQMEAVQYQRMMDEQSEYNQEVLQILNELMLKKEREKAELEKELEMYRKSRTWQGEISNYKMVAKHIMQVYL